ncbi:hypothetical protein C5Y96_16130 [Blastopirellula marina]|uniref:Uncharacterized protein n=1 Tax=Blastopirellula marina TaxID=124 RepID=A0A2S8F908_9BACT|nr:hypothetical protein C5Y96_16130 [Blastopirellula marina]RCS49120.1 hypothetical protein DTL36_16150 [Bremerella cremea]
MDQFLGSMPAFEMSQDAEGVIVHVSLRGLSFTGDHFAAIKISPKESQLATLAVPVRWTISAPISVSPSTVFLARSDETSKWKSVDIVLSVAGNLAPKGAAGQIVSGGDTGITVEHLGSPLVGNWGTRQRVRLHFDDDFPLSKKEIRLNWPGVTTPAIVQVRTR